MDILDQLMSDAPLPPPPTTVGQWSGYQQAIFTSCRETSANLLINAKAGSGKTSTICEATRWALGNNLFLAFNREIVEVLKAKATGAKVSTLNGLGYGTFFRWRPQAELDPRKVQKVLDGILSEADRDYLWRLVRAISLAKSNALGIDRGILAEDFRNLILTQDLEVPFDRVEEFSYICLQAFEQSLADQSTLDFDDQIYIPMREGWPFRSWSNVFVDEAQDLNPLQHLVLQRLYNDGARIIAVGDRHQAIYAFRGALSNSMDLLAWRFGMLEMPLSISYRCSLSVIREAQQFCPDIEARPGAPEGEVRCMEASEEGADPQFWPENHLVLCRNNAPLFSAILRYVRAKRSCQVKTNFLESFRGFLRSFDATTTSELLAKLDPWYTKERSAAEQLGMRSKLANLEDKYRTCRLLAEEFRTVQEILNLLDRLSSGRTGTIFSTIHRAKGLEAPHVYLLRPDLCPSPFASTPEAIQQELHLKYVAITRAQETFTYGMPLF